MRRFTQIIVAFCLCTAFPCAVAAPPLGLEATIALPNTAGRIDHLDIDLARNRLFVVELGNGSVDIVNLKTRSVIHRIAGLDEPQGVVYVPQADLLVVACGGDGAVRMFGGVNYEPRGVVKLGDDADNARLDPRNGTVVVGYGSGGLAIIDPVKMIKIRDVSLPGHPEAFQLSGDRAYVNVPDTGQIVVVDIDMGKTAAKWTTSNLSSNFPMALAKGVVAVAFRSPARLVLFDPKDGRILNTVDTCGDADDVFLDAKRQRYIVSCGAGAVDLFQFSKAKLTRLARMPTSWGARTSLFVPELDRLFVAERAGFFGSNATIQAYRPAE